MSSYSRFPYTPRTSTVPHTPASSSQYRYSTTNQQYGRFPTNGGGSGLGSSRSLGYSLPPASTAAASSPITSAVIDSSLSGSVAAGIFSQIAQITDHLYLCSAQPVRDARLRALAIKLVVNATIEVPPVRLAGVDTLQVPIDDMPYANIRSYFDLVADRINAEVRRGNKVLVHCMAGVSRSATLVLAYLMKYRSMSLREAHDHVKQRRPFIRPNLGFWRQLCDYEERLLGSRSVRMVSSPAGLIPDIYKEEMGGGMWLPVAAGGAGGRGSGRGQLLTRF